MVVPGETDLAKMLATLAVERRPGVFTYAAVEAPGPDLLAAADATVVEKNTTTLVMSIEAARRAGLAVDLEMAWLTLAVQSSLEAVGLTAAFSKALGERGISCNVLAGFYHDHILVPVGDVDAAIEALTAR
jgi:hypothetical protein